MQTTTEPMTIAHKGKKSRKYLLDSVERRKERAAAQAGQRERMRLVGDRFINDTSYSYNPRGLDGFSINTEDF